MAWRTDLINKFYNNDVRQLSGQIVGVSPVDATVLFNWKEFRDKPNAAQRGVDIHDDSLFLDCYTEHIPFADVEHNSTKAPKYQQNNYALVKKPIAFPGSRGNIQPRTTERSPSISKPASHDANQSKEFQMAKTAVFDSEDVLINVYDSGKLAKAAHKGATDLKFVSEKAFAPIGSYETVEALFPKTEKPAKEAPADGARTRVVVTRKGEYTVVKADGARFPDGDERAALHEALVTSCTVEEYMKKAPEVANFTSSRGAAQKVSASGYLSYGFKRGWVTQGDVAAAPEVVVEEAEAGE